MPPIWVAALFARSFPNYLHDIMQLLAYLGRYCHQPITWMESRPMRELLMLADATADLIKGEGDGMREWSARGGG